MALPQPRRVGRRRHKPGATEIEIALARSFRRQPQTMPEFKLGLEEIAAQPVNRLGAQHSGPDCCRAGPSNHHSPICLKNALYCVSFEAYGGQASTIFSGN